MTTSRRLLLFRYARALTVSAVLMLSACGGDEDALEPEDASESTTTDGDTAAETGGDGGDGGAASDDDADDGVEPEGAVEPEVVAEWPYSDCPSDTFLDVATFDGPGGDYPAPELNVTCTDEIMTVESNNIPHYEFVAITPNDLTAQDDVYEIPLNPVYADSPTATPRLGALAVAINGGSINGPSEAAIPPDQAFGDPVFNGILDDCLGHVGQSYHFHALLESCLAPDSDPTAASPVLGWSIDGFAIHGGRGCIDLACDDVVTFLSGYEQIGDPTTNATEAYAYTPSDDPAVLDECNGRIGPDGVYRYHTTVGYPYIMGCYHGEVTGSAPGGPPGG